MGLGFSTAPPSRPYLLAALQHFAVHLATGQLAGHAGRRGEQVREAAAWRSRTRPQTSGHPQGLSRKWPCMGRARLLGRDRGGTSPGLQPGTPGVPEGALRATPLPSSSPERPEKAGDDPSHQTYLLPSQPSKTWDLDTWTCHRDSEAATCSTITLTESTWKEQSWGGGEGAGEHCWPRGEPVPKGASRVLPG